MKKIFALVENKKSFIKQRKNNKRETQSKH